METEATPETTATASEPIVAPVVASTTSSTTHEDLESIRKAQTAIDGLSAILSSIPASISSSKNPAFSLLHDPEVAAQLSSLLRQPSSGAGDNHLCRWLYDTFQSSDPSLQLVVLRFIPTIAGVYLSRVALRKPLAGFEAVLLALYAHETSSRNGQAITVSIPDLSHSSIYHETSKATSKNSATELNLAVISPSLEPHGTVRSTRRARIVGVALELYYTKISHMPASSKKDFCEFCAIWAGQDGDMYKDGPDAADDQDPELESQLSQQIEEGNDEAAITERPEREKKEGRIPLPWELLQPVLRILGHCLMIPTKDQELHEAACAACRSLYARAMHDVNPKAILATASLLRLAKMELESSVDDFDPTEIPKDGDVINI
ncbi:uncharacterized protein LOC127796898 [Diospyros lotus]|uniref:uncharacterized protein LOC127796898 n=1 Tax=Diospyros lotus TaxID=55363 RepID=UPI00224F279C|nr:uncharacterized protein LOC127796898 [Diospyros lotus]